MPNVYKTFDWNTDVQKRDVAAPSNAKITQVNTTLSNFITHFKAKHSE